jgi:hypothetical protein
MTVANRQRSIHKQFRLTEKEAASFEHAVRKSGLTQAEYLRQLIKGLGSRDSPPPDYYAMMVELRQLRQMVERYSDLTNEYGCAPVGANEHLVQEVSAAIVAITKAVVEPKRAERQ